MLMNINSKKKAYELCTLLYKTRSINYDTYQIAANNLGWLVFESLESTLKLVTFDESKLRLWQDIGKK